MDGIVQMSTVHEGVHPEVRDSEHGENPTEDVTGGKMPCNFCDASGQLQFTSITLRNWIHTCLLELCLTYAGNYDS